MSEGLWHQKSQETNLGVGHREADGVAAPVQAGWAAAFGVHAERAAGRRPPARAEAETSSKDCVF